MMNRTIYEGIYNEGINRLMNEREDMPDESQHIGYSNKDADFFIDLQTKLETGRFTNLVAHRR